MADRKRLALVLPNFGPGGAERVALRLAIDFAEAGHEVDLVLLERKGELLDLVPGYVNVVDLAAPRLRDGLRPLIRYLRARRPHAIQISMWPLTVIGILAALIARTGTRVVTSDHIVLTKQYGDRGRTFRAMRWSIRLFYPFADSRIIVSKRAAEDLAGFTGLDRESIEVVYNPVAPPGAIDPAAERAAEAVWLPGLPRLVTAGTLKEQKNHRLLLAAFASLLRRRDAQLAIVGDGPLRGELEALAKTLGVDHRVHFTGFTANPWPYYQSADVFVLSSDYEGYPLVLIEALRTGLQIVSTDCESGPAEILDGGRYGRLVPTGDADALAKATLETLDSPVDPELLKARAESLSGHDTSARYLALMLGPTG